MSRNRQWQRVLGALLALCLAQTTRRIPAEDSAPEQTLEQVTQPAGVEQTPLQPPASPPQSPASADGTISVVVPPRAAAPTVQQLLPSTPARIVAPATPPLAASPPAESPAAELLAKAIEPLDATTESLTSRPLPLLEAIERSGDRARRLWITQGYWKVSAGCALRRFATEAVERLDMIAPSGDPHDHAALDVALAAAKAELAESRSELIAAQQELVDLVRLPVSEPLPWPVDRPLTVAYQTHFETIFAARSVTGRIRAINRMLPSRHETVDARGAAVLAAAQAFAMTEADHAQGKRPIESVLAAHAATVTQQREFVKAVKIYNFEIAEYVMAVADLSVPDERFASMLIGTPIPWRPAPSGQTLPNGLPQSVVPAANATPIPVGEADPLPLSTPPGGPQAPPAFVPSAGLQPASVPPAQLPAVQ